MFFFVTLLAVVVLDQLTKFYVQQHFRLYESIEVIPGFFNLTFLRNTGAAFGIFAGHPTLWRQFFFIGVAVIALVVLLLLYRKAEKRGRLYTLGLGLIAGGALGNLIDRIWQGSVVDFLDFYINSHHWPAFNVADSGITVGVGLLMIYTLFLDMHQNKKSQDE